MNRKHLIQFVATGGAVVVLYVLSFAPVAAHALIFKQTANLGVWIDEGRVYQPAWWLITNGEPLNGMHGPYFSFWLDVMRQRKFEELKANIEANERENPHNLPPDIVRMQKMLELEKLDYECNRKRDR